MFNKKYISHNKKPSFLHKNTRGFTLIEMIVSIGIFSIAMTLSLGALLVMNDSLRKTRLMKNAIDNARVAMELMSKKIRVGVNYHCGDPTTITTPRNCPYASGGDSYLAFVDGSDIIEYRWNPPSLIPPKPKGTIETRTCIGGGNSCNGNSLSWKVITTPDLDITGVKFYVENAEADFTSPYAQPFVIISINGRATLPGKSTLDTNFHLQTMASQRIIDLP